MIIWILKSRDGEIEAASLQLTKMMGKAASWVDQDKADSIEFISSGEFSDGTSSMYIMEVDKEEWGIIVGAILE